EQGGGPSWPDLFRPSTSFLPVDEVIRRGCPGHRRAEATPSFRRLCPGITISLAQSWYVMRLRISPTTTYLYEPPATGVIQILRVTPGSHDGQYVAEWQIDVSTDSRLLGHQEGFGNVTPDLP